MPEFLEAPTLLSRRGVLKVGLCASAFLATAGLGASLSGCSATFSARGFRVLRSTDLVFLQALVPVMLAGSISHTSLPGATDATLHTLDNNLAHLSPELLKLTLQLFDVLAMPVTRGPLTGLWSSWEKTTPDQIRYFLHRWQNSSLSLLRMGHASLLQLVMMSGYEKPELWPHCGYPGPPTV